MKIVTISSKNQITIPVDMLRSLGLASSDKAAVEVNRGNIILKPAKRISELRGSVRPKSKPEDFKKMRKNFIDHLSSKK